MNNSFPIYYEAFGNPNNPCIILIMGIGGQLIHWPNEFIQGLVDNGFFVVIFDNRDAGLSQYYHDSNTPELHNVIKALQQGQSVSIPYTLVDMANDVITILGKLQIKKAHILGISMGGMIAQLVAIKFPHYVLSLICIATTSGEANLPPAKSEVLDFFFSSKSHVETLESYLQNKMQLHKIYNHPDHVNEEEMRTLYIKTYQRAHRPDGFKRQLLALISTKPRSQQLRALSTPALIIHGTYDPVFSIEHGKQLANCIPNSKLIVIEKMGHGLPPILCNEIVNSIHQFIINI